MEYLVDSDWAIDYLNGVQRTTQRITDLLPSGIGISLISIAEIYDGIFGARNVADEEQSFRRLLSILEVVDIDDPTCRIFAQKRRRLRSIGALIGDMDLLIGATAIRHNVTLLTNNRRHFTRMQGLTMTSQ